jgi:hypothetical protein
MLVLEVKHGDATLVQGFVRCRWPAADSIRSGRIGAWTQLFVRSAMLWSQLRPLSAAIRISAHPGRPLETVHSFVVPEASEPRLRLVLAAFLRTHDMDGGESEAPQQQSDLNGACIHSSEERITLRDEPIRTSNGVTLRYNLRLWEYLPQIIRSFVDLNSPVAYEAQITPWSPPRDLLRQALYDAAQLQETRSAPSDLIRDQTALAERLRRAAQQRTAYHVEECLSSPLPQDMNAFTDTLANVLGDTIYARLGAAPELAPLSKESAEPFAFHVHSYLMKGTPDVPALSAVAVKEEIDRLISAQPLGLEATGPSGNPPAGAEPLFTSLTGPSAGPIAGAGGASASAGEGPFLFISYARADSGLVYPLVEQLARQRVSVWIDRKLIGGEDWISELEARLINCSGVLAVVSPSFTSSKYCVRELHFADALGRPIIPVFLSTVELKGGANFILHRIQRIMLGGPADHEAIIAAIRKQAPTTINGTKH